jgi:Flp pilus assembly protein TadG
MSAVCKFARLARAQRGSAAVEFALVAPTFLMFIFLILDGGRMIFAKLKQLTSETVRCYALKVTACKDDTLTKSFAVNRGRLKNLVVSAASVTVQNNATCFTRPGMGQVTISVPWNRGAFTLLPQSVAPANLVATSCFPIAS